MKVKLRQSMTAGTWMLTYKNQHGECVETYNDLVQAHSKACQIEGVQCERPWVPDEPLGAIREALEWLDAHSPRNARAVLVAALEADANRSHPELPIPF